MFFLFQFCFFQFRTSVFFANNAFLVEHLCRHALCQALRAFDPSPSTATAGAGGGGGGTGGGVGGVERGGVVVALTEEALWRAQDLTKLTKPQLLLCYEALCTGTASPPK